MVDAFLLFVGPEGHKLLDKKFKSKEIEIGSFDWVPPCLNCGIRNKNLLESKWYG